MKAKVTNRRKKKASEQAKTETEMGEHCKAAAALWIITLVTAVCVRRSFASQCVVAVGHFDGNPINTCCEKCRKIVPLERETTTAHEFKQIIQHLINDAMRCDAHPQHYV